MSSAGIKGWSISRVGILSTGSEILQGQYADTNARFLAEEFTLAGISVTTIIAAPDDESAVEKALRYCVSNADLVICTGGLGPTKDDVNRFVFERVFEGPLIRDEVAVAQMARRFVSRGKGPMPEANEVQALMPTGCVPLYNKWGTAPGFLMLPTSAGPGNNCGLLALPGPPSEMIPMFQQLALPAIQPYITAGKIGIVKTIHTFGHPESLVGMLVKDLFEPQPDVEFSILAKQHGVDLRIRATGLSQADAMLRISDYEAAVRSLVPPEMIYGTDNETLAVAVGRLLKQLGAWVTTAESCTGGMVASMIVDVPGSSSYVGECHVTYSNAAKVKILGVSQDSLDSKGAVSSEVAIEMAQGARRVTGADYAVGVTGVAGPDGGTEGKPVGLTYIAVSTATGTLCERHQLSGTRSQNRLQASQYALNMVRLKLLKDLGTNA